MSGPLVYRVGAPLDPSDLDVCAPGAFAEDALLQAETDRAGEFDVPPAVNRDATPGMLADPRFEAIWQTIRRWDINVPGSYVGYCGAHGGHVRAILEALDRVAK